MDLEISNNSLLSINSSLEAKVKSQAAQIEKLERKIASLLEGNPDLSLPEIPRVNCKECTAIEGNQDENDALDDQGFNRVCSMLDTLISDAKKALEYKNRINISKVLNTFHSENIPNASNNTSDEMYKVIIRNLNDICEEQEPESHDRNEGLGPPNSRESEVTIHQTKLRDHVTKDSKLELRDQRIDDLISQIWKLTDIKGSVFSEVHNTSIQKRLSSPIANSPFASNQDIMFSVLSQMKQSLGSDEMKKRQILFSNSTVADTQSLKIPGRIPAKSSSLTPR
ncbi:hypothetical protein K493DRAFT_317850 [Basidiobolus meristosporus CBS 931.73]|uniref:Uncharacterized protein n=1 Tax=Basidiobolus meristosporus CBS 931.73 TaxID=1314790 RepID=A0A1Y1XXY3_9FUNG|nr:hypothetical protein K493DRAFT_317850 [Basidiobolus meristosporus CBS 931.73]|eukprot:ORX90602.1 hypothetical protein K493DRAFT_317850 [Basidiobolus meristosporus CBS 931.73]